MDSTSNSSDSDDEMRTSPPIPKQLHAAKYTTTGRVLAEVPAPAGKVLGYKDIFDENDKPRVDVLKQHFINEGRISEEALFKIVADAEVLFAREPNLLEVSSPCTVCGDIHGQYYDLMKLLDIGGDPSKTTYLFLGDYVDRGYFSLECVLLLYTYKILYPSTFLMLRGNHECRHLTDYFTFKEEMEHKYSLESYDAIMRSFDTLPLSAILNGQFLCVHGGLSPDIKTIDDILRINRFTEPPPSGPMCDLLWADPMEDFDPDIEDYFVFNQVRGCSYCYSYRAVCDFLTNNKLLSVIRAHEAQDAGYRMYRKTAQGFPSVITLFSAPNYLDAYNNKAAILRYEDDVLNIRQFTHNPHPYWLPSFMDVLTWSMPFVAEKVAEILLVFLKCVDEEEDREAERLDQEVHHKKQVFRAKVQSVTRMLRMYQVLRTQRESVMAAKGISPQGTDIPRSISRGLSTSELRQAVGNFNAVKQLDKLNEARPPIPADGIPLRSSSNGSITPPPRVGSDLSKSAADIAAAVAAHQQAHTSHPRLSSSPSSPKIHLPTNQPL